MSPASPTTTCSPALPRAFTRESRRRNAWLKARAQYARDQAARRISSSPTICTCSSPHVGPEQALTDVGPKRKHSVFVQEEEIKFLVEDRVGTPHISEIQADDDVSPQLNVEELSVANEVAAQDTGERPTATDVPDQPAVLAS
jgi:hypothetical protein